MNIHRSAHVHDTRRERRKEATKRSGATAPTERHCADQARHNKTEQDKISILRGSENISPDWESPQDKPETPQFPQQKTVCPIVTHKEHHGNSKGTGNRRKNKTRQNALRQGSKHGNYNMPPRLIGRDPELRPVHKISGFRCTHGICLILPRLQIWEHAQTRRLLH